MVRYIHGLLLYIFAEKMYTPIVKLTLKDEFFKYDDANI